MVSYKEAGVDIHAEDVAIKSILSALKTKLSGHFSGIIEFGGYYLSMCTDGVGSKILVAEHLKKYDTVGIDMVAMNVNDVICIGATPLAMVDYLAIDKVEKEKVEEIMTGVAEGVRQAGVSVISGETATLPEVVNGFDLAGTCLGAVEKEKLITGESIKEGDVLVGLESSGVHSNGLTLARNVLDLDDWGAELLTPTRIYVKEILTTFPFAHGLSHVTGGGLRKIKRVLPAGLGAEISDPFKPQKVFDAIATQGDVDINEMYRTFNMGMGFVVICDEDDAKGVISNLDSKAKVVGHVIKGDKASIPSKGVSI